MVEWHDLFYQSAPVIFIGLICTLNSVLKMGFEVVLFKFHQLQPMHYIVVIKRVRKFHSCEGWPFEPYDMWGKQANWQIATKQTKRRAKVCI